MPQVKRDIRGWLLIVSLAVIASLAWDLFSADPDGIVISSSSDEAENDSGSEEKTLQQNETNYDSAADQPNKLENSLNDVNEVNNDSEGTDQGDNRFPVYIVGAINRPGIYKIEKNTCLYELIELAGGLTAAAAGDRINLAAKLNMYQLIRIPTVEEWQQDPNSHKYLDSGSDESSQDSLPKLININSATADELEELPGVGPSTAKAIIDHRTKNGPFKAIEELMLVPGIKENRYASLRDHITV